MRLRRALQTFGLSNREKGSLHLRDKPEPCISGFYTHKRYVWFSPYDIRRDTWA